MIKIYHNKLCSKSCAVLDLLKSKDVDLSIREYLQDVPSKDELLELVTLLQLKPLELIRRNESIFQEKFKNLVLSDEEWISVMLEYPILIERPIVLKDGKAVIGRPIDKVITLISES
ncbi:Arsenate reductase [compost metagenome]|uniref:ArsC/Spx/MgsR family protein n=1 Tax=unclassified Sphingobacterium TaxID=2609468 RepID=UPI000FAE0F10|nr:MULTISPECIES: ArsC/Spx/MgsR family protein [unclassified Sphingobacterium]MBB2950348.1 arsenate reductase [Sphingobacterium sp. JUb56]MCS3553052.1 arsenate reductase [Sphingobacterium sp. JUb21]TCR10194.1 arsenate reductase [Sphingobacterium sp. JUb20]